jgi:hypothetical protein
MTAIKNLLHVSGRTNPNLRLRDISINLSPTEFTLPEIESEECPKLPTENLDICEQNLEFTLRNNFQFTVPNNLQFTVQDTSLKFTVSVNPKFLWLVSLNTDVQPCLR